MVPEQGSIPLVIQDHSWHPLLHLIRFLLIAEGKKLPLQVSILSIFLIGLIKSPHQTLLCYPRFWIYVSQIVFQRLIKPYKTSHKTLLTSTALKLSVEQRAKKHKQRENRLPEVMKVLGWYELHYPVAFSEFPWCACARRVHLYATCLSTWEHFCLRSLVPVPSWGAHPIIVTLFIWSPRATRQNWVVRLSISPITEEVISCCCR